MDISVTSEQYENGGKGERSIAETREVSMKEQATASMGLQSTEDIIDLLAKY